MSRWNAIASSSPARRASLVMRGRHAIIGVSLFHTVGDRDRAAEQINSEFNTLAGELLFAMHVPADQQDMDMREYTSDPAGYAKKIAAARVIMMQSPLWSLWANVFSPIFSEWKRFYADQSSMSQFFTNWEEYEHWFDRLSNIRASIERQMKLTSPTPISLAQTLPGRIVEGGARALDKTGDLLSGTFDAIKYAIYAAVGLGTVAAGAMIVQNFRKSSRSSD